MNVDIANGSVRRVLLADGWHAVEDVGERGSGSSFQAGPLRFTDSSGGQDADAGFSFVDHHTKKRIVGPLRCIQALETD
jgi:hypothetical protein